VIVTQTTDQLGEQPRVSLCAASQGQQRLIRRRAERVGQQCRHRVVAESAQRDAGGTVPPQEAEQVLGVLL
jgi:hypothetical protein